MWHRTPRQLLTRTIFLSFLVFSGCTANREPERRPEAEAALRVSGIELVETATLPDPLAAGWHGERVCESLHEDASQRILRCTFPPGVGHERHFHAPHFGYVVAGSIMRITDENGTSELEIETGSSWVSEGTAWHEVVNVGETTGVYIIIETK
jgi:quercetin dioxygenase-like cupin family protein